MRIWAVALNTFRETVRNRVLLNILLFVLGLILLSLIVGEWSIYQQTRVIKNFGLSAMSMFGLLIAVFIGIRLMVQELEQRTIALIASKPVRRWKILAGKYLGLSMTLAVNVVVMSAFLWFVTLLKTGTWDWSLTPAIVLIYVEILLIVGFALFYSTFMSSTLSAVLTLVTFAVGHLSPFLWDFVRLYPDHPMNDFFRVIYYILPNLEHLNLKLAAVEGMEQSQAAFWFGLAYGLIYTLLILFITGLVFEKKDLK
jgi:ABC-type transport system involved in multi-copper enzyme maturation permease subunit